MKAKNSILIPVLFILAILSILLLFTLPVQGADIPGYEGYPTSWGYPPPVIPTQWAYPPLVTQTPTVDPWCEEIRRLGKNLPWWCPTVTPSASLSTTTHSQSQPTPQSLTRKSGFKRHTQQP